MSACNARPPQDHPLYATMVACHLADDHLAHGQPHAWDIEAVAARAAIITRAVAGIRERFGPIDRFDVILPAPIEVYQVDKHGQRAARPYRRWDQMAGPWVLAWVGEQEFAIWKETGNVYRVGEDGAVEEDPVISA